MRKLYKAKIGDKRRRVEVTWIDSIAYPRWQDLDEALSCEPAHCVTIGYLLRIAPSHIVLAQNVSHNVGGVMVIPSDCVKKIRRLK